MYKCVFVLYAGLLKNYVLVANREGIASELEKQFQRNVITADSDKAGEVEVTTQVASKPQQEKFSTRKFSSDRL